METYHFERVSCKYQGKLELKEALKIQNKKEGVTLYVVDDFLTMKIVETQLFKHFLKLVKMLEFYLESNDDTGVAYQEVLNESERFRRMLKNKKRFLLEQEVFMMERDLKIYEDKAKRRLIMLNHGYVREQDNRRRK